MKNKTLDEIKPSVKGVKVSKKQMQPKVVKDVMPSNINLPPPSEEAAKVVIENNRAKNSFFESIKEINRLMNRQVLPENRSGKENDEEQAVISNLVHSALDVESFSPGEGLLGMAILAIRQGFSLRDAGNRLAYELKQLKLEIKSLKEQLGKKLMVEGREIISSILEELDKDYASYQDLHRKFYKTDDDTAKLIHRHLIDLCKRILKEMSKGTE